MPLVWDATAKLIRLQGMAEELLASARGAHDSRVAEAVDAQVGYVDSLEQQRAAVQIQREAQESVRRKHTIGFRIRSPLTREPKAEETTEQPTR